MEARSKMESGVMPRFLAHVAGSMVVPFTEKERLEEKHVLGVGRGESRTLFCTPVWETSPQHWKLFSL